MRVAISANNSITETVERCRQLGVTSVFLKGPGLPGVRETGIPDGGILNDTVQGLRSEGLLVTDASWWFGRYPERPWRQGSSDPAFLTEADSPVLTAEVEAIKILSDIGIRNLLHYIDVARPDNVQDEPLIWDGLLRAYEFLIPIAESTGICLGNHSLHRLLPDGVRQQALDAGVTLADYGSWRAEGWGGPFLVDTWEALDLLVTQIESPHNGITLCTGMEFLGADLADLAHRFSDRIHFCQIRDHTGGWPEGIECPFGQGNLDIAAVIETLEAIGYAGAVHPEHLGKPGPDEDPLADAVGMLRSLGLNESG